MLRYLIPVTGCTILLLCCTHKMTPSATGDTPQPHSPAVAAPAPPPPPPLPAEVPNSLEIPLNPKVRMGRLPNGMTYYILPNQKPENRAELRLAVKAGSMQEDEDQLGLAHFTEHMAFNGSTHFSKNELVNYLESVGSRFGPDLNAYTSFDETVYMLQVRTDDKDQFDKGLLILKDWAFGLTFDTAEIDKERGVVVSEWRTRLSPYQRLQQEYFPELYYRSRYANRLPIGDPEIINHASYPVIRRFYADWYRPELMAVFLVGAIDPEAVETQIRSMFGDYTLRTIPRKKESNAVPPHDDIFIKVLTDPEATNTDVRIINKMPYDKVKTVDDYQRSLTENLYNRMLGRRLSDISQESNPPFIFGNTSYGQDVGDLATYSSFARAEAKDIKRAYQALLDENQRVLLHGFTASELEREKANMLRQAEQGAKEEDKMESNRMVSRLINHFLEGSPVPDAGEVLKMNRELLPKITLQDVNALAQQWISNKSKVIIITAPEKDKAVLPDSIELLSILRSSAEKGMAPYVDVDLSAPLLEGTFPAQQVVSSDHDAVLDVYTWRFANGIRVMAKPTEYKNDEILMAGYSPGGHSLYNDQLYPSARGASSVVGNSGIGTYNDPALDKKLTGKRVGVSPFIFERYEGINGSSSVQDLETMLQLTYGYLVKYREDTVALSTYLNRERSTFGNLMLNPQNWFSDKVSKISSQYHPRRGFPTLDSYDEVNMKDIMKVYRDRFSDVGDMQFFFVGNFNPDSLQYWTSRYLGALPGKGRAETWKDVGDRFPKGRIDSTFYRGEAPKTLVQIQYHGDDVINPDTNYLLQSLIDVARIKLRESLREDAGGVYGVSIGGSQSKFPIDQYVIRISFNVDPPRTQELLDDCDKVIGVLKMQIDTADIRKVTEAQRQGRIKDLQQNQFWLGAFITTWLNGTDLPDAVSTEALERRIASLTPARLSQAARKYFNNDQYIRVVMNPAKKE